MQQPERLLFDTAFVSIMKAMPETVRPQLKERWKKHGVDADKLLPGYPFLVWCRCIEEAASFLEGSRTERHRQLGRSLVTGFSESLMGRAIAPLARLHGPQRSLERAPTLFRQTNNYMQPKVELAEPRHVQIRVNEVSPIPDLLAGAIEAVIDFTGGREAKVVFEQGTTDTVYDVRWG